MQRVLPDDGEDIRLEELRVDLLRPHLSAQGEWQLGHHPGVLRDFAYITPGYALQLRQNLDRHRAQFGDGYEWEALLQQRQFLVLRQGVDAR